MKFGGVWAEVRVRERKRVRVAAAVVRRCIVAEDALR